MKLPSINMNAIISDFKKHDSQFLMGAGIAGVILTGVLLIDATPKALKLIEEAENKSDRELKPIEKIGVGWKPFIPAFTAGVLSISCLLGANSIITKQNAALMAAYTLSDSTFNEYKKKIIESMGEEKDVEIRESIAKDRLNDNPVSNPDTIIIGNGDILCYEILSGRYFKSDTNKIDAAINEINDRLLKEMSVSLDELYYELGLPNTKLGNAMGWNNADGLIRVNYSSQLTPDGIPCIVVDYDRMPSFNFDRWA